MSKIFSLCTLVVLSFVPLFTFAQPVPPVFFTPNDLYNHCKSMDEKLEAIEIGTVLYNPHQRVRSDEWHQSNAWFDEHHAPLVQGYDLTFADVYLNVKDVEMARWMIAALSNAKSLTILCHTKFDHQTKLSFKALTQKWARAGKSLMVIDAGVEDENINAYCSCFLAAQIQQIMGEGHETNELKHEMLDGLRELRKEARDLAEKRRAAMAVGEDVGDDEKLVKLNGKISGIEKSLMAAVHLVTPDMHAAEKCAIFTSFFEDEVEVSEALQVLLAEFIQKRKAVWQQRTPKSNQDNYDDIIKTLTQLNDQEATLVMERAATDFNHVVEDISPYVELIAQFLYPQRFDGKDSLYEAAEKRKPLQGTAANVKKYEACLAAFPLSKLDDEAALSLIKSYFLNPIDDKFYKWGAELYEFGAELGQQFAALPDDKQEEAFQLAKTYRDIVAPKVAQNDDDDVIVHDLFSRPLFDDWVEAVKLICFVATKATDPNTAPQIVKFMGKFYLENRQLPYKIADFMWYPEEGRLSLCQQLVSFPTLLGAKQVKVSTIFMQLKLMQETQPLPLHDQLTFMESLRLLYNVRHDNSYHNELNQLRCFFTALPVSDRERVMKEVRPILAKGESGWVFQLTDLVAKYNAELQRTSPVIQARPVQPQSWGEFLAMAVGLN